MECPGRDSLATAGAVSSPPAPASLLLVSRLTPPAILALLSGAAGAKPRSPGVAPAVRLTAPLAPGGDPPGTRLRSDAPHRVRPACSRPRSHSEPPVVDALVVTNSAAAPSTPRLSLPAARLMAPPREAAGAPWGRFRRRRRPLRAAREPTSILPAVAVASSPRLLLSLALAEPTGSKGRDSPPPAVCPNGAARGRGSPSIPVRSIVTVGSPQLPLPPERLMSPPLAAANASWGRFRRPPRPLPAAPEPASTPTAGSVANNPRLLLSPAPAGPSGSRGGANPPPVDCPSGVASGRSSPSIPVGSIVTHASAVALSTVP